MIFVVVFYFQSAFSSEMHRFRRNVCYNNKALKNTKKKKRINKRRKEEINMDLLKWILYSFKIVKYSSVYE